MEDRTVDMGTSLDCFHEASWHNSDLISDSAQKNRKILKDAMLTFGFLAVDNEWWHYTFKDTDKDNETKEDYDFPVE